jgi:hypothetical protein
MTVLTQKNRCLEGILKEAVNARMDPTNAGREPPALRNLDLVADEVLLCTPVPHSHERAVREHLSLAPSPFIPLTSQLGSRVKRLSDANSNNSVPAPAAHVSVLSPRSTPERRLTRA